MAVELKTPVIIPLAQIEANDWNPNEMHEADFKVLKEDIGKRGFVAPIIVRAIGKDKFQIVDGEHRYFALKQLDAKEALVVIIDEDEDAAKMDTVRFNILRGNINAIKMTKLVSDLLKTKTAEQIQRGMALGEEVFRDYLQEIRRRLPKAIQKQIEKGEIKSPKDLERAMTNLTMSDIAKGDQKQGEKTEMMLFVLTIKQAKFVKGVIDLLDPREFNKEQALVEICSVFEKITLANKEYDKAERSKGGAGAGGRKKKGAKK